MVHGRQQLPATSSRRSSYSDTPLQAQFFFQVVFCAVSLAIVFGAMLDRTKFIAYIIFGVVFTGLIYPIVAHWTWGGGWLAQDGFLDFAGSSIVHLQGALAATRRNAPARRAHREVPQQEGRTDSRALDPACHARRADPVGRLDGLQPRLDAERRGQNFADIAVNTNLAAAAGVIGATISAMIMFKTLDVRQMGNGAIAGLVAITAPCAFVDPWAAVVIGLVAGLIVPPLVVLDRQDPGRRPDRVSPGARRRRYLGHAGGRSLRGR